MAIGLKRRRAAAADAALFLMWLWEDIVALSNAGDESATELIQEAVAGAKEQGIEFDGWAEITSATNDLAFLACAEIMRAIPAAADPAGEGDNDGK